MLNTKVVSFIAVICLFCITGSFATLNPAFAEDSKILQIIEEINGLIGMTKQAIIKKFGEPEEKFFEDSGYSYMGRKIFFIFNEELVWGVGYEHPRLTKFTKLDVEKVLGKPARQFKDVNKLYVRYKVNNNSIQLVYELSSDKQMYKLIRINPRILFDFE